MSNRIVFLGIDRLRTIIETETTAGRRAELAEALLRLLHLHASYISPRDEDLQGHVREGQILACVDRLGPPVRGLEFAWHIMQDPRPNGHGGTRGDHVLNGGLIQHSDLKWGIHT